EDVKLVRECLHHFGQVDVARDVAELDVISKRISYDCVILPMSFDRQDGLRIASRLRTNKETRMVPLLMIASDEDAVRVNKAMDIGVNDYLMRPIDALELVARVRTQIRRKRFTDSLRENLHMSIKLATTDSVTGLYNRHYMTSQLNSLISASRAHDRDLSIAILDLDKFKSVNDTHGHTAGDEVLQEFARRISQSIRGIDLAARYGGEEFVVIMPDTSLDIAAKVGERLRALTAGSAFPISADAGQLNVTVSIGVAQLEADDQNITTFLERADEALYEAKHAGRNQVRVGHRSDDIIQQAS
ncbi:MAG: diguanylate cyclase, partial [Pseudomonadota bacterium]